MMPTTTYEGIDQDIPDVEREINATNDALHGLRSSVDGLIATLKARDGVFTVTLAPQATHIRMIAKRFVFSVSAACTVTLTVGSRTYLFDTAGPVTLDLPAPFTLVDRGVDIFAAVSAGNLQVAYLTFGPE
jgi:hypothetical protein